MLVETQLIHERNAGGGADSGEEQEHRGRVGFKHEMLLVGQPDGVRWSMFCNWLLGLR